MAAEGTKTNSIIHPVVDTLAIGGLSIAFLVFLMLFEPPWNTGKLAEEFIVLTALFNWPHFMATYGLMYKSETTVKQYPWASMWIPLALGVATAAAVTAQVVVGYEGSLKMLTFMAGAYLAWHYTGQAWGMMASFSFLDGAPIKGERPWIRTGLRILLAWHVIWFLHAVDFEGTRFADSSVYLTIYHYATYTLIPLGALVGGIGLYRYWKRIERTPPPRVLIPFLSIVLWYVMMAINPLAIFWVQISHAIQYLIFPVRVEMNRGAKREKSTLRSGVLFAMVILGLGVATFELLPRLIDFAVPVAVLAAVKLGVGNFINIHHFFADGVIWKISNPAVRKELFAHVER